MATEKKKQKRPEQHHVPELVVHGLDGQVDVVDLVLHVPEFLQQVEGTVQLVQRLHMLLQPTLHIGAVRHRGIQLFLLVHTFRFFESTTTVFAC